MTALVDCSVKVGGTEFNDGSNPALDNSAVILAGLSVVWGRNNTLDQPEASTCKFRVIDPTPTSKALDVLTAGAAIDVDAAGNLYPPASLSTFADPALTSTAAIAITGGKATAVSGAGLDVDYTPKTTAPWEMTLYPAPVSNNPAAWDAIPKTSPGQTWQARVTLTIPLGMSLRVTPVLFATPDGRNPVRLTTKTVTVTTPPYAATLTTFNVDVATGERWVGLFIESGPTTTWKTVGTVTWAEAATMPGPGTAYTWQQFGRVRIGNADVFAPSAGTTRTVRVFSGRVTDLQAEYDASVPGLAIDVTATDFTADLMNRRVGDVPFLAESYTARFNRVLTLADPTVTATIAPTLAYTVSWVDIDSQPAMSILQDLTTTVDGVLWAATHITTGPYLKAEDPAQRPSARVLKESPPGTVVVAIDATALTGALTISSCDVLRDPVQWVQDVTDVVTRVAVTWQEQGVAGPDMGTTEHTETFIDPVAEKTFGTRAVSVSTDLISAADARQIGSQIQARTSGLKWRTSGLAIDAADLESPDINGVNTLCELLDGTTRIGREIVITDMPPWAPTGTGLGDDVPAYVEGGEYTYDGAGWVLALVASADPGTGRSALWNELDTDWLWKWFAPSVTWLSMRGAMAVPYNPPKSYPGIYPGTTYPGIP